MQNGSGKPVILSAVKTGLTDRGQQDTKDCMNQTSMRIDEWKITQ
jgi:hypothetical protein